MVIQRDPCSACSTRALRHTRCRNVQTQGKHILILFIYYFLIIAWCLIQLCVLRGVRADAGCLQIRSAAAVAAACAVGMIAIHAHGHFHNLTFSQHFLGGGGSSSMAQCVIINQQGRLNDVSSGWEAPLFELKTLRYVPSEVLSPLIVLKRMQTHRLLGGISLRGWTNTHLSICLHPSLHPFIYLSRLSIVNRSLFANKTLNLNDQLNIAVTFDSLRMDVCAITPSCHFSSTFIWVEKKRRISTVYKVTTRESLKNVSIIKQCIGSPHERRWHETMWLGCVC